MIGLLGFLGPPLNTQPALSRSFTQSDWKSVSQNLRHAFTAKVFVVSAVSPLHWIRCICPMPVYIWPTTRHPLEHGSEESMIWITEVRFTRRPLTKTNNSLQLLCHFYNMLQLLKLDIWLVVSFCFGSDVSCPWPWILQLAAIHEVFLLAQGDSRRENQPVFKSYFLNINRYYIRLDFSPCHDLSPRRVPINLHWITILELWETQWDSCQQTSPKL